MFIKEILVKNFKCFKDTTRITFNYPTNSIKGSGLNVFVGENNSGKSTIFEAIDFLRNNTRKDLSIVKNKNSDEQEMFVEITFVGNVRETINNFAQENKKKIFEKYIYICGNEECLKLRRALDDIKEIRLWNDNKQSFINESGIDAPLKKIFEINFIWADTNPNDEASFGATTICGNLLKEIIKDFAEKDGYKNFRESFNKTFNSEESELRKELKRIENRTQEIFKEQFGEAHISFHFEELKIESFFKNAKIEIDDGTSTFMEEKGSGMQRSVALALLQVYAEELTSMLDISSQRKPFFLFIDEPEICLHPKSQNKLFSALLGLSSCNQIFISTHSPYFVDPAYVDSITKIRRDDIRGIEVYKVNWSSLKNELKLNRNFFLNHRELFFSNKALFLEGIEDYERYSKFCLNNGYEKLVEFMITMNGCDVTLGFEKFCNEFGVDFYAIVDVDFAINRSKWARGNRKKLVRDIKSFFSNNDISFESDKFDSIMLEELIEKPREGDRKTEEIFDGDCSIHKVINKNIFVLKDGEVKDYLNKNGAIINNDINRESELKSVFGFINKGMLSDS